ncbi:MAG: nicotinate-nucleotide adenylyltransferase [Spirulinaceae cyanobacterium]
MKKIALFGTSADPPTAGHNAILRWLSQRYDLVAVWASDNPFKSHQTSLEHRVKMLEVLIDSLEDKYHNVNLHQKFSNRRTLETVKQARQVWGDLPELTLVIGSDLPPQMSSWYGIKELLPQVLLLVIPRPGYPIKEQDLAALDNLGGKCAIADFHPPSVSSTAYREYQDPNAVIPSVKDYIQREQLYI